MNRIKALKELSEVFNKYDCNIYEFCHYLGITNVKEDVNDNDLIILLDKYEELNGEYTDPIEVGQSLANIIYEDKTITLERLKSLDPDRFNEWYINGREVGNQLEMEEREI